MKRKPERSVVPALRRGVITGVVRMGRQKARASSFRLAMEAWPRTRKSSEKKVTKEAANETSHVEKQQSWLHDQR